MIGHNATPGTLTLALLVALTTALWSREAGPPGASVQAGSQKADLPGQGLPVGSPRVADGSPSETAALEEPGDAVSTERLQAQPQVTAKLVSETLVLRVYFAENEVRPGPQAAADLTQLAEAVAGADSVLRLRISAHSDDDPDEERNQALSDRRAQAVRAFLERLGVSALRVEAEGYGSLFPENQGQDLDARARNRRAEIRVEWVERLPVTEPAG
jgi:outer membrane protein OmpA-like peptidoglycan-associated protein